jgi:hypothetical protein
VKMKRMLTLILLLALAWTSNAAGPPAANAISAAFTPPTLVSAYDTPGSATGVAVDGGYAYVADGTAGLRVIQVSRPTAPAGVGACDTPYWANDVTVAGPYAYVADLQSGLRIVDVSDPARPYIKGFYDTPWDANQVALSGHYAFVADGGAGMQVINVSNPAQPQQVTSLWTPGYAAGIAIASNYAYLTCIQSYWPLDQAALVIASISAPASPTTKSTLPMAGVLYEGSMDVAVAGGYAYVANTVNGLRIIDVSDPAHPFEAGAYAGVGAASGVAVRGDYAYVAAGNAGLHVVDVSDPAHPAWVGAFETPGAAADVAVAGNYVYVAVGDHGLLILWFAPPVDAFVPASGGSLTSATDGTTYLFAPGTFTETVILTHTAQFAGSIPATGDLMDIGHAFEASAVYSGTGQPAQPAAGQFYTVTVQYSEDERGSAIEDTLGLYGWNGDEWSRQGITSTVDVSGNVVTAQVDHFSLWAVLGETRRVYLALALRGD